MFSYHYLNGYQNTLDINPHNENALKRFEKLSKEALTVEGKTTSTLPISTTVASQEVKKKGIKSVRSGNPNLSREDVINVLQKQFPQYKYSVSSRSIGANKYRIILKKGGFAHFGLIVKDGDIYSGGSVFGFGAIMMLMIFSLFFIVGTIVAFIIMYAHYGLSLKKYEQEILYYLDEVYG